MPKIYLEKPGRIETASPTEESVIEVAVDYGCCGYTDRLRLTQKPSKVERNGEVVNVQQYRLEQAQMEFDFDEKAKLPVYEVTLEIAAETAEEVFAAVMGIRGFNSVKVRRVQ